MTIKMTMTSPQHNMTEHEPWNRVHNLWDLLCMFSPCFLLQWTHDAIITPLLRRNDVVTSFRRNNDVIIASWVQLIIGDTTRANMVITTATITTSIMALAWFLCDTVKNYWLDPGLVVLVWMYMPIANAIDEMCLLYEYNIGKICKVVCMHLLLYSNYITWILSSGLSHSRERELSNGKQVIVWWKIIVLLCTVSELHMVIHHTYPINDMKKVFQITMGRVSW